MSNRDAILVARNIVANIAVLGMLTVGAAVASPATAAADPAPDDPTADPADSGPPDGPPPPAPPMVLPILGAPLANGLDLLGQRGGDPGAGPLGLSDLSILNPANDLLQNAVPSAPGAPPGTGPNLRAFNNAYTLPQNDVPSAPGHGTEFGVDPGDANSDTTGGDYLRHIHSMYSDGRLKGLLLGQTPPDQLGQPLPGTAPPPGTNLPPGLVQYLPDPAAPADPAAPPPPPG
jgi:hypothetical protein